MEIVVLLMAAMCFLFGLIAINRADQISIEDQQFRTSLGVDQRSVGLVSIRSGV